MNTVSFVTRSIFFYLFIYLFIFLFIPICFVQRDDAGNASTFEISIFVLVEHGNEKRPKQRILQLHPDRFGG
jgi:hypothetical protein